MANIGDRSSRVWKLTEISTPVTDKTLAALSEGYCECGGRIDPDTVEYWTETNGNELVQYQCLKCRWLTTLNLTLCQQDYS